MYGENIRAYALDEMRSGEGRNGQNSSHVEFISGLCCAQLGKADGSVADDVEWVQMQAQILIDGR